MTDSKYQLAIYDFVGNKDENGVVKATAGSGKTYTIVKSCDHIRAERILLCSFNRHIADHLTTVVPPGVESNTLNSIGYGIVRNNLKTKVNKFKNWNILRSVLPDEKEQIKIRSSVDRLICLMKNNLVTEDIVVRTREMINYYGIEIHKDYDGDKFEELFEKVYTRSIRETKEIDFDDQKLQPIILGMGVYKYDMVLVDESQDLSMLDVEFIKKIADRAVFVGDPYQSIYGFRSALPEAMDTITEQFQATELPLSICYRCPEAVIDEAKTVNPTIESPTDHGGVNAKGEGIVDRVEKDTFRRDVSEGDFVLCRTTAPLIKECLKMLPYKKCYVRGRDIGEGLERLVKTVSGDKNLEIGIFDRRLDEYFSDNSERLQNLGRDVQLGELEDKVDSLKALMERCSDVDSLNRVIKELITDNGEGICFCTIHKSKGLEANNIWILRWDLVPHPRAKKEWQLSQEVNLKFVAITRSMQKLIYVNKERNER
jgi:DNA helicase-2/ATP-dependent DNA helicase PcrA